MAVEVKLGFRPLSGNKGNQLYWYHQQPHETDQVSVPSRGIRVINVLKSSSTSQSPFSFRPLSGNKGNQRVEVRICFASILCVSVPSRGIRVINSAAKACNLVPYSLVSVPSRGIRVINPTWSGSFSAGSSFRPLSGNKGNQPTSSSGNRTQAVRCFRPLSGNKGNQLAQPRKHCR